MKTRKALNSLPGLTLAALLAVSGARAASEFEDAIPVELVKIFLGLAPDGDAGLYREIPEDFPLAAAPPDFRVLGVVKQEYAQSLFLATAPDEEAAEAALADALAGDDWLRLPDPVIQARSTGGFVSPQGQGFEFPVQFCHDEHGMLQMTYQENAGEAVVALRRNQPPAISLGIRGRAPDCREQVRMRSESAAVRQVATNRGLTEHMPRLELPGEAEFGGRPPGPTGGISSNGRNEVRTGTDLAIDWAADRLYAHFGEQLAAQMWSEGDSWRNAASAGGIWTRQAPVEDAAPGADSEAVDMQGVLTILQPEAGRYLLEFRLVAP